MLFLRSWIFTTVMFALLEGGDYIYHNFPLWSFLFYLSAATGIIISYVYHVYETTNVEPPK